MENKSEQKGITNYWQVIVLKSRHTDYHLYSLISYLGFHHITHISWGKKREKKVIFPVLVKLILPPSSTSSESPKHYFRWSSALHLNYYLSFITPSSTYFDDWIQKSLFLNTTYWSTKLKISHLSRDSFVQHWGSESLIVRKLKMYHLFQNKVKRSHYVSYCSLCSPKTAFNTTVSFSRQSCKLPKFSQNLVKIESFR